jgi:hypothetical protein
MNHLTEEQLGMALSARRPVEQWIASKVIDGQTVIHWVRIEAHRDGRYIVCNKHVYDPNNEDLLDVSAFPPSTQIIRRATSESSPIGELPSRMP